MVIGDFPHQPKMPRKCRDKFLVFAFKGMFLVFPLKFIIKKYPPFSKLCREVQRYLLASIAFWMNQFGMDGFRFLDVASMIYLDRGRCGVWMGCGWVVDGCGWLYVCVF